MSRNGENLADYAVHSMDDVNSSMDNLQQNALSYDVRVKSYHQINATSHCSLLFRRCFDFQLFQKTVLITMIGKTSPGILSHKVLWPNRHMPHSMGLHPPVLPKTKQ